MENASKALLIAAAVLVVIIIIAFGMKVYTSSSGTGKVAMNTGKTISDKTGEATDLATYEITGKKPNNIKYYEGETETEKAKENVHPGDTIKIGTERFKVFLIDEEGIKAMPYYNLDITKEIIKQGTSENNAISLGRTAFSEIKYWDKGTDKIYMKDSRNKIQKFINAYKTTLEGLGLNGIKVRAARYSELNNYEVLNIIKNLGKMGSYWLGSSSPSDGDDYVYIVYDVTGAIRESPFYNDYNGYIGVRPIIIIPK